MRARHHYPRFVTWEYQIKRLPSSGVYFALIAFVLFFAIPSKANEQDAASARKGISYDSIYRVFCDKKQVEREGSGALTIVISDKAGKIPNDQIELHILSVGASRQLGVNKDGTFEFPLNSKLQAENPAIVSNLPVGRTKLDIAYLYSVDEANQRFYAPLSTEASYGDLLRGMKKEYAKLQNILARTSQDCQTLSKQVAIEVRFPSGITLRIKRPTGTYVVVHAKSGDLRFPITPDGFCPLPIRPDLLQENPPIQIPGNDWSWRIDYDQPSVKRSTENLDTI